MSSTGARGRSSALQQPADAGRRRPAGHPGRVHAGELGASPPAAPAAAHAARHRRLDVAAARPGPRPTLIPQGVKVIRDPHIGTGISKSILVDWGQALHQPGRAGPSRRGRRVHRRQRGLLDARPRRPDGRLLRAEWAAIYATRVRRMMNTYRRAGAARVYWLTLPTPREAARASRSRAWSTPPIVVAAEPWPRQVTSDRHRPDLHPGQPLPRRDDDRRHADDRARIRRHPPQRRRLRARRAGSPGRDRPGLHSIAALRSRVLRIGPLDLTLTRGVAGHARVVLRPRPVEDLPVTAPTVLVAVRLGDTATGRT